MIFKYAQFINENNNLNDIKDHFIDMVDDYHIDLKTYYINNGFIIKMSPTNAIIPKEEIENIVESINDYEDTIRLKRLDIHENGSMKSIFYIFSIDIIELFRDYFDVLKMKNRTIGGKTIHMIYDQSDEIIICDDVKLDILWIVVEFWKIIVDFISKCGDTGAGVRTAFMSTLIKEFFGFDHSNIRPAGVMDVDLH